MINIAVAESWQAYQGPDQIKLEIVASPIQPYGGGGGLSGRTVYSEKMRYF